MLTETYNGHTIELYDSVQDLPIDRFQTYNLNLLIDAGVGSDVNSLNIHSSNIIRLAKTDPDGVIKEAFNLQNNIQMILTKTSPKLLSFAALVKSIDGKPTTSEEVTGSAASKVVDRLARTKITMSVVDRILGAVKKK